MPSSSRIVFAEDLVGATPWTPGSIDGERRTGIDRRSGLDRRDGPSPPPSPTYEDGLRDGYSRGLEQARADGDAALRERLEALAARGDALIAAFTAQLAALQGEAAADVVSLAVEIARSATGVALRVREDVVGQAVAQALAAIAEDRADPVVRVNPEDASAFGETLEPLLAARGARLVPDAAVAPGGCIVDTPHASVDATVATRWKRALAALGRDDEWIEP